MKWLLPAVVVLATGVVAAQSPFVSAVESVVHGGRQLKGLVPLEIDGKPVEKRYVLRTALQVEWFAGHRRAWRRRRQ